MRDVWNKLEGIALGHGNVPRYRLLESAVLDRGLSDVPREEHLEDHVGAPGKAPIEGNEVLDRMGNDESETEGRDSHDRAPEEASSTSDCAAAPHAWSTASALRPLADTRLMIT
jgi:hypothetical protein